jgi:pilus assembly protein CpaE
VSTETETVQTTRVFFTGDCDGFSNLRESLSEHPAIDSVGSSENVSQAAGALAGGHLDVVLHATRHSTFPASEIAAIREHTRAPVIVVASDEATDLLDGAIDAEVADVLLLPQLVENVVFTIRKTAHVKRATSSVKRVHTGRVVTVFSPKGGTGKTVTAVNVAATLAKHLQKRTLLIDLDLQFGDAAIVMGIEPEKTIYDLVVAPGELDFDKLLGYTTKHQCGLDILPAPLRPEDAELVTEPKITRLLEVARECYDVIVVDTSPFFHGPMLATLDRTDELLMLCGLDVPTLKNVRLALQTLELLSFPTSRIRFVLNRANSKVGLTKREVEAALKVEVANEVPSERVVPLSVNRGEAAVLAEPGAEYSKAILELAKSILPQQSPPKAKRRGLSLSRS